MTREFPPKIRQYLETHRVATLATSSGDLPWAAAVFYAMDGTVLYFLSSPKSRHCRNLAKNPRVALTVQEEYADWLDIKGVQLEGEAREISGAEEERARKLYGEKFPVVGLVAKAPAAIVKALAKVRWYKVEPERVYFVDNEKGLGEREEFDFTK